MIGSTNLNLFDFVFVAFVIGLLLYYQSYISRMVFPAWDAAAYLENARNWLQGEPLMEPYRPPLLSWIVAGIWSLGGESWESSKYVNMSATVGAGILLYFVLRKHKGSAFALGVTSLTMLNPWLFFNSTQVITEGLALFFVVLTLFFLKSQKRVFWAFAGITIALSFASRYPIIVPALTIFLAEAILQRKRPHLIGWAFLGLIPTMLLIILAVYVKNDGSFSVALEKDTGLSATLSGFYFENAVRIFGYSVFLIPLAFVFKRTYREKYNFVFIIWFVVSLLFWSANEDNHQERFMIQVMPAAYYLAILAIENLWKSRLSLSRLNERHSMRLYKTSTIGTGMSRRLMVGILAVLVLGSVLLSQNQVDRVTVDKKLYDATLANALRDLSAHIPPGEVVVTSSTGPQVAYFTGLGVKIPRGPDSHQSLIEYMWKNDYHYLLVFENQSKTAGLRPLVRPNAADELSKTFENLSTFDAESSRIHLYQLRQNLTSEEMVLLTDSKVPAVDIIFPTGNANVTLEADEANSATLVVRGTSADKGSGIKSLEVRIEGETSYSLAIPLASKDWSIWLAKFQVFSSGMKTITAKATDFSGNQKWHEINVNLKLQREGAPIADTSSILVHDPDLKIETVYDGLSSPTSMALNLNTKRCSVASVESLPCFRVLVGQLI